MTERPESVTMRGMSDGVKARWGGLVGRTLGRPARRATTLGASTVVIGVLLAAITTAGGFLRADAASDPTVFRPNTEPADEYMSADETAYGKLARSLADHGFYGQSGQEHPVHWPPGAPFVFGLAHTLDPQPRVNGNWDVPGAYPAQVAVGTATILAAFALAFVLAGPAAGLVAAGLVAFYPPLIDASGQLLSEPLGALLVTLAMLAVALALRRPAWWRLFGAGILLGATVLTRADLILVPAITVVVVAIVLWHRLRRDETQDGATPAPRRAALLAGARGAVLLGVGCLLLVGPWSWYASREEGEFVPISSGGASNLFIGTFLPGDGRIVGMKRALIDDLHQRSPNLDESRPLSIGSPEYLQMVAQRRPQLPYEQALRAEGLANLRQYALGRPLDFAAMMAGKIDRLWLHYTVQGRTEQAWIRILHLVIVAAAVVGLVAAGVRRRAGPTLWLLGLVLAYVTALNAVLVSEARHNLTVMPLVVVAGVVGITLAVSRTRPATPSRGSQGLDDQLSGHDQARE